MKKKGVNRVPYPNMKIPSLPPIVSNEGNKWLKKIRINEKFQISLLNIWVAAVLPSAIYLDSVQPFEITMSYN